MLAVNNPCCNDLVTDDYWVLTAREGEYMDGDQESRILICTECDQEFVFTIQAQQYFAERGYTDDPKRCKSCHTEYKKRQRENNHRPSERSYREHNRRIDR